jgi:hypothetical protein
VPVQFERHMKRIIVISVALQIAVLAVANNAAAASPVATEVAGPGDQWQFGAFIYGFFPSVGTKATLPNGATSSVTIDAKDLLNNLKFAVQGAIEAQKGNWGAYSDFMYMNAGKFKSQFHDLILGNVGLPADVSSSTNLELKSVVWTLAGSYRAIAAERSTMDVVAGARLLEEKVAVDWTLNGNIASIPVIDRAGTVSARDHFVDGIVGIKGRVRIGANQMWFLPYYGDIGTGNSRLTWQLMAGVGYAFGWGELIGGWRHIDYEFRSDSDLNSSNFDGAMLGAAFHW